MHDHESLSGRLAHHRPKLIVYSAFFLHDFYERNRQGPSFGGPGLAPRPLMELTFLGAAGTVTGSRYLVTSGNRRVLVDCGLFQGPKELRLRNWSPLPVRPADIDVVVLTHAHLDHSGYLPLLVRSGFAGRIFCSAATAELCDILLPDSAHLQEEDADYANRHHFSKHHPALPLYTQRDVRVALERFTSIAWQTPHYLGGGLYATFHPAGHIIGAAIIEISDGNRTLVFSGDLGRSNDPITIPPTRLARADYVVIESTYGACVHEQTSAEADVGDAIARVAARGGVIVVPAFAVGRAQALLYYIQSLKAKRAIPDVPVFINSPMAADATDLYCRHRAEHRLDVETCMATCRAAHYVRDVAESKALNERKAPMVIISASGMLAGGRVLHHIKAFGPDPRNAILLVGYQGVGTRGAALVRGDKTLRIHGEDVPIRAEVIQLGNLSAHADAPELMAWLRGFESAPKQIFVTHGEPASSVALSKRIDGELGWSAQTPVQLERVVLSESAPAEHATR